MQLDHQYQLCMWKSLFHSNVSNFWRSLGLPFINCETDLGLSRTEDCVLKDWNKNIASVNFVIISTKCYAPVVTLKHTTKKKTII